jgi:hypothetical protein
LRVGAGDGLGEGDGVGTGDAVRRAEGAGVVAAGKPGALATGKGGTEEPVFAAVCGSVAAAVGDGEAGGAEVPPEEPLEQPAAASISRAKAGQRSFMMVF